MAVNQLYKLVGALESTAGSAVSATRVLYINEATPSQEVTSIATTTLRGDFFETYEINPGVERNGLNVSGPVFYSQIPFWLEGSVKGGVTLETLSEEVVIGLMGLSIETHTVTS